MNTTLTDLTSSPTFRYWLYTFEGLLLIPSNGVILLSILYHNIIRERKEYILPAALAFCDTLEGFAAFSGGTARNWMIAKGRDHLLVPKVQCLMKPWNLLWIVTNHLFDPILLALSCDRLIAVGFPLFHYGLTRSYALFLLFCAWAPALCGIAFAFYSAVSSNLQPNVTIFCFTTHLYEPEYRTFLDTARVFLSTASVLLYVVIIFLYWRQNKQQLETYGNDFKRYLKNQNSLTVTLGLSCIFTTIFYVLPVLLRTLLSYLGLADSKLSHLIIPYTYIWENVNRFLNLFLYSKRHIILRKAIHWLFLCKQLTLAAVNAAQPTPNSTPKVMFKRPKKWESIQSNRNNPDEVHVADVP